MSTDKPTTSKKDEGEFPTQSTSAWKPGIQPDQPFAPLDPPTNPPYRPIQQLGALPEQPFPPLLPPPNLPVRGYLPSGAQLPVLTVEQERVLLEHLPIVRFLARRIHERLPQHVDIEDLVSAGVVGLMDSFSKFDPAKKVQFRSYAQFRIRGAILDSVRTLDWSPRELRRKGQTIEKAIRILRSRFGRTPSDYEVATEMALELDEYQQLLGDLKGLEIGTLHLERNEDSGDEDAAYIPGRPEEDPLFCCLRGELEERLAEAIQNLPDRERLVMSLYYYEEMTMHEIGMALGVVESRVSQVHASAVKHLRTELKELAARGVFDRAQEHESKSPPESSTKS